ncbi:MAG: VWA domain-containing protein [Thiohalophilus sp.]|uniref:nitric oxide reductase activation protein NorD n=1 Tax=Thiohalophilus sp. TaxID=3028392 RepID=UPI002870529E|nr:VWA domain-containing protein [Thiohalophilus sp.]MDR9435314.1 VWA domain-containing protein [Thiohalophilus sp.]
MADTPSLDLQTVIERLDNWLDVGFSGLKTETTAAVIAALERDQQEYLLAWVQRLASANIQLAYHFITHAVDALNSTDRQTLDAWVVHAMDSYDQHGLHKALETIRTLEDFVQLRQKCTSTAFFDQVCGVLSHFVYGLSGRRLQLCAAEQLSTDTEIIYLPSSIDWLTTAQENFLIYKCLVACHWAQIRYGTFREPLGPYLEACRKPEQFLDLFQAFESVRVEAGLKRELPGLYRTLQRMRDELGEVYDGQWLALCHDLRKPTAQASDSLQLTQHYLDAIEPPARSVFYGRIQPDRLQGVIDRRMENEKTRFRQLLRNVVEQFQNTDGNDPAAYQLKTQTGDGVRKDRPDDLQLTLNDEAIILPEEARSLLTSIVQDVGYLPDEYLIPAGRGEYEPTLLQEPLSDPDDANRTFSEAGAYWYREWDFRRQHYRKNWCTVREHPVAPVNDDFYCLTLDKYRGLIRQLRKNFEAMRDEQRRLKREVHGDDVDIDALVEALADSHDGREMSDRLFTRLQRTERNIAVMFMVDMSGSTRGWVNDAEREALILLAEALQTLGDRYAIYGFSGMARERCEVYPIKEFGEAYDARVRARISGMQPRDYTRMGAAIRHLSGILNQEQARNRILITLSDGKPDDYDNYRGRYGIEDTRRALLEARHQGIHPYCITIDREARAYLPHLYGPASFTLVREVRELPYKISEIYRRLTH